MISNSPFSSPALTEKEGEGGSPRRRAEDAVTIDTSALSIEQVLAEMLLVIRSRWPVAGGQC